MSVQEKSELLTSSLAEFVAPMAPPLSLGVAAPLAAPPRPRHRVVPFRATAASPPALDRRRRRPQNVPGEFFVGEHRAERRRGLIDQSSLLIVTIVCVRACVCLQTTGASTARPAGGWRRRCSRGWMARPPWRRSPAPRRRRPRPCRLCSPAQHLQSTHTNLLPRRFLFKCKTCFRYLSTTIYSRYAHPFY